MGQTLGSAVGAGKVIVLSGRSEAQEESHIHNGCSSGVSGPVAEIGLVIYESLAWFHIWGDGGSGARRSSCVFLYIPRASPG